MVVASNRPGEGQAAWRALLDVLRDADGSFLDPARAGALDDVDVAEGYRHLTHLLAYAFDLFVESDPDHPELVPLAAPTRKILGDNTDSVYRYTNVRGDRRYRIHGRRGDDCYLSVIVHGGPDRARSMSQRTIASVNHTAIPLGPDGAFEITLSADPAPGAWLRLEPDALCVITREYYTDRQRDRPATMAIECLDDVPVPPPLGTDVVADRLRACARFVAEVTGSMVPTAPAPVHEFQEPFRFLPTMPSWGTPDNVYCRARFELAPDEALVVEGTVVPCTYWGVQLWNPYMQSLDWRYHRVSLNHRQAHLGADGAFRVVLAHEDPGVPDWISTAGHRRGSLFCRWLLPEAAPPRPTARVVPLAQVRAGGVDAPRRGPDAAPGRAPWPGP